MRLSRPCYDKPHRCPGWVGGGMLAARRRLCADGHVYGVYGKKFRRWRFNRCDSCDVLVLPLNVEYLDWRYWQWKIRSLTRRS